MRALLPFFLLFAACEVCKPADDTALDYQSDSSWACRPGTCDDDLSAATLREDGTVEILTHTPVEDPRAACFWVYPTIDLSLTSGVHDDFSDPALQRRTVIAQAAAFTEVCDLHAPLYRQVTLGVYANRNQEERDRCFGVAADDVKRAFTQFLSEIGDRPFVIGGHSQGGQVTSTIVRDVIEPDPALHARMIAALPIGWAIGVGEGGTFAQTPICEAADDTGCALSFRSVGAGNKPLRDPRESPEGFFFGDEVVCTNPVADGAFLRARFTIDHALTDMPEPLKESGARFAIFPETFTARCANEALEITALDSVPVDLSRSVLSGESGTHLIDMQLAQDDLAALVARKIDVYSRNAELSRTRDRRARAGAR